jgi:hypothetical protein
MPKGITKFKHKLQKAWLKMLKAYTKGKYNKAHDLEQRIIQFELKIKREEELNNG